MVTHKTWEKNLLIKYLCPRDFRRGEMEEIMIEFAQVEDKEDIYNLICILENKKINKEHFDYVFENALKNEDVIFLVYRNEKVDGFMGFKIHHYLHHSKDTGEIVELVVVPAKRGMHIGSQLIQKIEEIARLKNIEQIEISTSTYRMDAHRFYESHGYIKLHYNYTKDINY